MESRFHAREKALQHQLAEKDEELAALEVLAGVWSCTTTGLGRFPRRASRREFAPSVRFGTAKRARSHRLRPHRRRCAPRQGAPRLRTADSLAANVKETGVAGRRHQEQGREALPHDLRVLLTLLPGEQIGNPLPETLEYFLPEDDNTLKYRIGNEDLTKEVSAVEGQISVDSFLDLGVPVQRTKIETPRAEALDGSHGKESPVRQDVESCVGGKVANRVHLCIPIDAICLKSKHSPTFASWRKPSITTHW